MLVASFIGMEPENVRLVRLFYVLKIEATPLIEFRLVTLYFPLMNEVRATKIKKSVGTRTVVS